MDVQDPRETAASDGARLAAENERLRAELRAATRRSEQLRDLIEVGDALSSSLLSETTLQDLGRLIVPRFADWYAADLVAEDGTVTNVAILHADPSKVALAHELRRRRPPGPDDLSGTVVVARTGRSEWFREIPDELLEQLIDDPELREILRQLGLRSSITVPLVAHGATLGALTLIAAESGRLYDEDDVRFAEELGRRAGLAIDDWRLLVAERQARARVALVARTSNALAEVTGYESAFRLLGELVLESLADFCLIDVVEDDGSLRQVVYRHSDPARRWVQEGLATRSPDAAGGVPAAVAVRTGRPTLHEVTEEVLAGIAADEEHLALIREIGGQNFMAVPLVARGRVLGAMTLSSTSRRYGPEDVELATEIAARAAVVIDNARLLAAERRSARRLAAVARVAEATMHSGSFQELLNDLLVGVRRELGTQMASVLLLEDDGRVLRMKATVGVAEEIRVTVAVPVGKGFAGRIVANRAPSIIEDTRNADIVSGYLRQQARSVVGVPLVIGDEVIGVLHTASATHRVFREDDVTLLQVVAEQAAVAIRRAQLYEREHRIASILQQSLLPAALPDIPGLDLAAVFRPSGQGIEVGGDFYDVFEIESGRWGIAAGDVCGKGPEAATVTALARDAIRTLAMRGLAPREVLAALNDTMLRSRVERFCTAVFACIEPGEDGATMTVARGGHPGPLLARAGGGVETIEPRGALLGVFETAAFEETTHRLRPGDVVVAYTDGLVEHNPTGMGEGELPGLVEGLRGEPAEVIAERLASTTGDATSFKDDVVIVVAKMSGCEA